jgi:SAM-dependent methyltransferase
VSVPPLTPLAVAVLRVGKPERILVVGCGEGDPALFLAREFPGARVRGVDRDEAAVRRATDRVGLDPEGRVAFKTGSPRDLPFPDDGLDLVVLLDTAPAPGETARVLRPGGWLLLVDTAAPPADGWRERLLWRRLGRHGIERVELAAAGEGGYSLARLRGATSV